MRATNIRGISAPQLNSALGEDPKLASRQAAMGVGPDQLRQALDESGAEVGSEAAMRAREGGDEGGEVSRSPNITQALARMTRDALIGTVKKRGGLFSK